MVDVLRSRFERDPEGPSILTKAKFSKDGAPIDVITEPVGFLGPFDWWPSHLEKLEGKPYILPASSATKNHAGRIVHATEFLDRVALKAHVSRAFLDILALPPLCMSENEWKALGLTFHSPHGSPSDMAKAIPEDVVDPTLAFSEDETRQLGHWRRLSTPPAQDGGGKKRARKGQKPNAREATDGAMSIRYTAGNGRVGRRKMQMRVHLKWVRAIQKALKAFARPWSDLPTAVSITRSSICSSNT